MILSDRFLPNHIKKVCKSLDSCKILLFHLESEIVLHDNCEIHYIETVQILCGHKRSVFSHEIPVHFKLFCQNIPDLFNQLLLFHRIH